MTVLITRTLFFSPFLALLSCSSEMASRSKASKSDSSPSQESAATETTVTKDSSSRQRSQPQDIAGGFNLVGQAIGIEGYGDKNTQQAVAVQIQTKDGTPVDPQDLGGSWSVKSSNGSELPSISNPRVNERDTVIVFSKDANDAKILYTVANGSKVITSAEMKVSSSKNVLGVELTDLGNGPYITNEMSNASEIPILRFEGLHFFGAYSRFTIPLKVNLESGASITKKIVVDPSVTPGLKEEFPQLDWMNVEVTLNGKIPSSFRRSSTNTCDPGETIPADINFMSRAPASWSIELQVITSHTPPELCISFPGVGVDIRKLP